MIPVELTPSQERSVRLALKTARLASELRVANEKIARVEAVLGDLTPEDVGGIGAEFVYDLREALAGP